MRKILLSAMFLFRMVAGMMADTKVYTEQLVITVAGEDMPAQQGQIEVETLASGNINFTLKNFILGAGADAMPVGNVKIQDIAVSDLTTYKKFTFNGNITMEAGDSEVSPLWIGPDLGEVPVLLKGKMTDSKLVVSLDIILEGMGNMHVHVAVGTEAVVGTQALTVPIVVTMFDEATAQTGDIVVENLQDGEINFTLKNFILGSGSEAMPVGNVAIRDINLVGTGDTKTFATEESIVITAGQLDGVQEENWLGPSLGYIPLKLQGKMAGNQLYVNIDIDMSIMQVQVQVGQDFDGIASLSTVNGGQQAAVFNLAGQRVSANHRGITIQNGHKVLR